MVETTITFPEQEDKINKKELMSDILYSVAKGISGAALKVFTNLKVEGEENIPIRGKAIITTVSKNAMRDILIISQISGRKIHFMLSPKLMKHKIAGPILKTLGMFRSTTSKDDTEPIEKVFKILNEKGNLVAMTPEAKLDREVQVKTMAAIIKFAIAANAPIIPVVVISEKTKLFNMIPAKGLKVKVGTPLKVEKKLNREKFRDKRYELAEEIIKIIEALKKNYEE